MANDKALIDRRVFLATSAALGLGMAPVSSRGAITRQANAEIMLLTRGEIEFSTDTSIAWRVVREVAEIPPTPPSSRAQRGSPCHRIPSFQCC